MYVEAVIYWLDENGECMLAFNLKRASKIIAIPQHEWTKNLIELKGSLCLAAILRRGEVITWILVRRKSKNQQEEEEVQWVPGFTIRHCSISRSLSFQLLLYVQSQSQSQRNINARKEELDFQSRNKIFYYDIMTGGIRRSSTNLHILNTGETILYPCAYVETLFRILGN